MNTITLQISDEDLKSLAQAGATSLQASQRAISTRGPSDPAATADGGFVGHVDEIDFGHGAPTEADMAKTYAEAVKWEDNFRTTTELAVAFVQAGVAAKVATAKPAKASPSPKIIEAAGTFFQKHGKG